MVNIPESDQWKSSGDCSKCRRSKYCGATCIANKRTAKKKLRETIMAALNPLNTAKEITDETKA